jgi:hypothetical protein
MLTETDNGLTIQGKKGISQTDPDLSKSVIAPNNKFSVYYSRFVIFHKRIFRGIIKMNEFCTDF